MGRVWAYLAGGWVRFTSEKKNDDGLKAMLSAKGYVTADWNDGLRPGYKPSLDDRLRAIRGETNGESR